MRIILQGDVPRKVVWFFARLLTIPDLRSLLNDCITQKESPVYYYYYHYKEYLVSVNVFSTVRKSRLFITCKSERSKVCTVLVAAVEHEELGGWNTLDQTSWAAGLPTWLLHVEEGGIWPWNNSEIKVAYPFTNSTLLLFFLFPLQMQTTFSRLLLQLKMVVFSVTFPLQILSFFLNAYLCRGLSLQMRLHVSREGRKSTDFQQHYSFQNFVVDVKSKFATHRSIESSHYPLGYFWVR